MDRHLQDPLTSETILAIQRILQVQPNPKEDPFDGLAEEFNAVDVLNSFFPDGKRQNDFLYKVLKDATEASLEKLQDVQSQLADTQQQLQEEIDGLQAELKRNQDPERMTIIQEMISVCLQVSSIYSRKSNSLIQGPPRTNVAHPREGYGIRGCSAQHNEGHPGPRPREEKPDTQHDNDQEAADARCVVRD